MLFELGLIVGKNTQAGAVFDELFSDFMSVDYSCPSDYVNRCWSTFKNHRGNNSNLNGKVFEYILATLCIRENILPLYLSAKVAFVPNVLYDLMFYTAERGPICWSAKTSLRERYKQADLEAIALKYVHRKALNYLITLDEKEAVRVKEKIKSGSIIGLDNVILATGSEFDTLVEDIKTFCFEEPPTLKVIESKQIITMEKVRSIFT